MPIRNDRTNFVLCYPTNDCFFCKCYLPRIEKVIFNDPATVVFWKDGTKTVVKCNKESGDVFNKEHGLAMAISKKALGNCGNFNNTFKKWIEKED